MLVMSLPCVSNLMLSMTLLKCLIRIHIMFMTPYEPKMVARICFMFRIYLELQLECY